MKKHLIWGISVGKILLFIVLSMITFFITYNIAHATTYDYYVQHDFTYFKDNVITEEHENKIEDVIQKIDTFISEQEIPDNWKYYITISKDRTDTKIKMNVVVLDLTEDLARQTFERARWTTSFHESNYWINVYNGLTFDRNIDYSVVNKQYSVYLDDYNIGDYSISSEDFGGWAGTYHHFETNSYRKSTGATIDNVFNVNQFTLESWNVLYYANFDMKYSESAYTYRDTRIGYIQNSTLLQDGDSVQSYLDYMNKRFIATTSMEILSKSIYTYEKKDYVVGMNVRIYYHYLKDEYISEYSMDEGNTWINVDTTNQNYIDIKVSKNQTIISRVRNADNSKSHSVSLSITSIYDVNQNIDGIPIPDNYYDYTTDVEFGTETNEEDENYDPNNIFSKIQSKFKIFDQIKDIINVFQGHRFGAHNIDGSVNLYCYFGAVGYGKDYCVPNITLLKKGELANTGIVIPKDINIDFTFYLQYRDFIFTIFKLVIGTLTFIKISKMLPEIGKALR